MKVFLLIPLLFLASCASDVVIFGDIPDDKATIIDLKTPEYPWSLRQQRIEGWVVVNVTIDEKGRPSETRVVKEHPVNVFSNYAIEAVENSKFRPAHINSKPVKSEKNLLISFKIGKGYEDSNCENTVSDIGNSGCKKVK